MMEKRRGARGGWREGDGDSIERQRERGENKMPERVEASMRTDAVRYK